jgi:hypothetical protein
MKDQMKIRINFQHECNDIVYQYIETNVNVVVNMRLLFGDNKLTQAFQQLFGNQYQVTYFNDKDGIGFEIIYLKN